MNDQIPKTLDEIVKREKETYNDLFSQIRKQIEQIDKENRTKKSKIKNTRINDNLNAIRIELHNFEIKY